MAKNNEASAEIHIRRDPQRGSLVATMSDGMEIEVPWEETLLTTDVMSWIVAEHARRIASAMLPKDRHDRGWPRQ
jgi:hypothetical protein